LNDGSTVTWRMSGASVRPPPTCSVLGVFGIALSRFSLPGFPERLRTAPWSTPPAVYFGIWTLLANVAMTQFVFVASRTASIASCCSSAS
jgi:hypothetical protein